MKVILNAYDSGLRQWSKEVHRLYDERVLAATTANGCHGYPHTLSELERIVEDLSSVRRWSNEEMIFRNPSEEFYVRTNKVLIQILEELGPIAASASTYFWPSIVEVPDHIQWRIGSEEMGEWVEEVHQSWHSWVPKADSPEA